MAEAVPTGQGWNTRDGAGLYGLTATGDHIAAGGGQSKRCRLLTDSFSRPMPTTPGAFMAGVGQSMRGAPIRQSASFVDLDVVRQVVTESTLRGEWGHTFRWGPARSPLEPLNRRPLRPEARFARIRYCLPEQAFAHKALILQ